MIQNLLFGIYLLISGFLLESLTANKNEQKDHLYCNIVSLKKRHFTNLNSLNIIVNIYPQQPKTLLPLQIFQQTCFWWMSRKTFVPQHF